MINGGKDNEQQSCQFFSMKTFLETIGGRESDLQYSEASTSGSGGSHKLRLWTTKLSILSPTKKYFSILLAEGRGFEPPVAFATRPFQDRTLDHSDTLPYDIYFNTKNAT